MMNAQFDEKGKIFTNVISKLPIPVTIQTTTHRIHGELYVRPEERLMDELNSSGQFLAVTNATIFDTESHELYRCSFLTLSLRQIVWLIPDNELGTDPMQDNGVNG
jgi:hypothetical protein